MAEQSTVELTPARGERPPASGRGAPKRRRFRRFVVSLLLLAALAASAFFLWKTFFEKPRGPERVITLSGRIEGDDSAVAPKTAGRILEIRYREGDTVKAGDTIAILDDAQILAREEQAKAVVRQSEAKAQSARDQIAVLQEQLRQGQLQTEQARIDAEGRVQQAEADLAAAESDLAQQQAAY
jgi:HlyD family secretion protein